MKTKCRILPRIYFNRPTLTVARSLIGKYLVRSINGRMLAGKIVEVEAYVGPQDKACHASKGRTQRTDVMFGPGGVAYVYLIYGMYHCLNVVTEREEFPSAVLIRAIELDGELIDGPGRLCRALEIDRRLNLVDLTIGESLWFEDRGEVVGSGGKGNGRRASQNRCRLCGQVGRETLAIQITYGHNSQADTTHKKTGRHRIGPVPP